MMSISVGWALTIGVTVSIAGLGLSIYFKDELKKFLSRANEFTFRVGLGGATFEVDILQKAQQQMQRAGVLASRKSETATERPKVELADLPARDRIIESWGSLQQIVYDAAVGKGITLTPATRTRDALERLLNARLIDNSLANAVTMLYEEGKKIASRPGEKVRRDYASIYQGLVYQFIDWMMTDIIAPKRVELPSPAPIEGRRTSVAGYFPSPGRGQPAAILVGVRGAVKGRQFAIEQDLIRLGTSSDNELIISGDDYVSAEHANIHYDNGSLLLADQHSRNGTYLNENRLKEAAITVNPGDRIRVGGSTFKVVQTPGR